MLYILFLFLRIWICSNSKMKVKAKGMITHTQSRCGKRLWRTGFNTNHYMHSHVCSQEQNLPLQWRHNGRNGVLNHQPHNHLLNHLFRPRSKKTSKLRVTGLCARNSPGTGEFPAQMASNAENVSIWWHHHAPQGMGQTPTFLWSLQNRVPQTTSALHQPTTYLWTYPP